MLILSHSPRALRIVYAVAYNPLPSLPTATTWPARSQTVLMPLSALATICTGSGCNAATTLRFFIGFPLKSGSIIPL